MIDPWHNLTKELDRWEAQGRVATFWWRDDDATEASPDLNRLLHLKQHFDVPLHLAIIPQMMQPSIIDAVAECLVLQHGVHHVNRAPADQKKSEFPDLPLTAEFIEDIKISRQQLQQMFGPRFLPVMVPPWNRISKACIDALPQWGFRGLSRYKARDGELAAPDLGQVNTHLDPIAWRHDRGYIGDEDFVLLCTDHLKARRLGKADFFEPTGLLSHHKDHDEDIWAAIFKFLDLTSRHGAARWITLPAAFSLMDSLPDGLSEPIDDEEMADSDLIDGSHHERENP